MTKEQFLEHCGWSEEEFDHIMHLLAKDICRAPAGALQISMW